MLSESSQPRFEIDVVDEVALPQSTAQEVEQALARFRLIGDGVRDLRNRLPLAEYGPMDISVVELLVEGVGFDQVRQGLSDAQLAPADIVTGLRVLLLPNVETPLPFALMCIDSVHTSPVLALELLNSETLCCTKPHLTDNDEHPELGWSEHCLIPARRGRSGSARRT